jgi:hypothetical protein
VRRVLVTAVIAVAAGVALYVLAVVVVLAGSHP